MILERLRGERFSRVLPLWKGLTVALLGGGPSLTLEQFELAGEARHADRIRAIAVNDAYLLAPWADVHYAADAKWHRWHAEGIAKPLLHLSAAEVYGRWKAFPGQKCTIENAGGHVVGEDVHVLRNRDIETGPHAGLSSDRGALATGRHGGFQALNLAILAGASKILLLGYDAKRGPDGATHFHGSHPITAPAEAAFAEFRRSFSAAQRDIEAAGVQVLNCSPNSSIETFPKMELQEALA